MPILADHKTRAICMNGTTKNAIFHMHQWLLYGTNVVGTVDHHSKKKSEESLPCFFSIQEAKKHTNANTCVLFCSPDTMADAMLENIEAEIPLLICFTDHIPAHDFIEVLRIARQTKKTTIIGPASSGIITPEQCNLSTIPTYLFQKGSVGIVSRSPLLLCEAACQMKEHALGQSTCITIGNRERIGYSFIETIEHFEHDPETKVILLLGMASGTLEYHTAQWLQHQTTKPILVYLAGHHTAYHEEESPITPQTTLSLFQKTDATVIKNPLEIGKEIACILNPQKKREP